MFELSGIGAGIRAAGEGYRAMIEGIAGSLRWGLTKAGYNFAAKQGAKLYSEATFNAFERQLAKDGLKSILKTQSKIQKNLAIHKFKLDEIRKAGGYSSSVEREIKTFQAQLHAINDLLK